MESYKNHKAVIEDIIKYLESWFDKHTIGKDKKIGEHLKSQQK